MKKIITACLVILSVLASCKDEKECTLEFKVISVAITNFDDSPASFDEIHLIRLSSSDTLPVANDGGADFKLIDDSFEISESEDFLLQGYQQEQLVVSETYTLGHDGCHVSKISGRSEITLD